MTDQVAPKNEAPFFGGFLTHRHLMTRRIIIGGMACFALVAIAIAIISSSNAGGPAVAASGSASEVRILDVEVLRLNHSSAPEAIQIFTGTVQPRRSSTLAAKLSGRVEAINVDIGSSVNPNQLLAQLDDAQVKARIDAANASLDVAKAQLDELLNGPRQQDIATAESQVREATASLRLREANYGRIKRLYESNSVSLQEFDQATFQLDAIGAQLTAAKENLKKLEEGSRAEQLAASKANAANIEAEIRVLESDLRDRQVLAPYAGQIQNRFVDEGTIVSPGQQILQIVEAPPYEVRVGMPVGITKSLEPGCIRIAQGDRVLDATLARIAPALNESTQTREVVFELTASSSHAVSLGSAVTVFIKLPSETTGYWVPTASLTAGSRGLWAIYIAQPNATSDGTLTNPETDKHTDCVIERRQVELLRAGETWSEVQGPLSAGERIVSSGVHRITPGQAVHAIVRELSPIQY